MYFLKFEILNYLEYVKKGYKNFFAKLVSYLTNSTVFWLSK